MLTIARPKPHRKTLGETLFVHEVTRTIRGTDRSGNEYKHPRIEEHFGQAATCAKCKKQEADEGLMVPRVVSSSRLSPTAWTVVIIMVVIGATFAGWAFFLR